MPDAHTLLFVAVFLVGVGAVFAALKDQWPLALVAAGIALCFYVLADKL